MGKSLKQLLAQNKNSVRVVFVISGHKTRTQLVKIQNSDLFVSKASDPKYYDILLKTTRFYPFLLLFLLSLLLLLLFLLPPFVFIHIVFGRGLRGQ